MGRGIEAKCQSESLIGDLSRCARIGRIPFPNVELIRGGGAETGLKWLWLCLLLSRGEQDGYLADDKTDL